MKKGTKSLKKAGEVLRTVIATSSHSDTQKYPWRCNDGGVCMPAQGQVRCNTKMPGPRSSGWFAKRSRRARYRAFCSSCLQILANTLQAMELHNITYDSFVAMADSCMHGPPQDPRTHFEKWASWSMEHDSGSKI